MKLGLVIKNVHNGNSTSASSYNTDNKWIKSIIDIQLNSSKSGDLDMTNKPIVLLRFLGKNGYIIGAIKPELGVGRLGDYTAAWIYFPAHISISGKETFNIIIDVQKAISGRNGNDDDRLSKIFNTDYEEDNLLFSASDLIESDDSKQLGLMYYGENTKYQLHELLGKSIAQPEYKDYKGIFFVDMNSGITLIGNTELEIKVKPECLIKAPKSTDGFIPNIGGNEFKKDLSLPSGNKITVVWKKTGFEDIIKDVITKENYDESKLMIDSGDYKVSVLREWFKVCDEKGNVLDDVALSINELHLKDKLIISFDLFNKGVIVTALKQGYDDFRKEGFKISRNEKNEIKLTKKIYSCEFTFDRDSWSNDQSFKDIRLIIKSEHRIENSPIKGFRIADRGDNYLSPDNLKLKLKFFAGGVITCLIPVLLIAGWNAIEDYEPVFAWPPLIKTDPMNPNDTGLQAPEDVIVPAGFIAYLDSTDVWLKDSLEGYTPGFYDLLIEYKIDSVNKMDLKSSNLHKIINTYEENKQAVDSMNKAGSKYKPDTMGINFKDYIKYISEIKVN